jgi:acetolactate decarboxylase
MRVALKQGKSEGRVALQDVVRAHSFGVGALAGLEGEVTIIDGQTFLALADDEGLQVRNSTATDEATLLVLAEVENWQVHTLPACADYSELEVAIAAALTENGFELNQPTPFRITGEAVHVELHVIRGNCPIANPSGAKPWRLETQAQDIDLVGFFAEDSAGKLTHHTHRSHAHVVALDQSFCGHLDEIALTAGAFLWLPN